MGVVNKLALGLTLGTIYGVMLFLISLMSSFTGWGKDIFQIYSSFFPGFENTLTGSIIGLIYGILFGFIFGYLLGALYNHYNKCFKDIPS